MYCLRNCSKKNRTASSSRSEYGVEPILSVLVVIAVLIEFLLLLLFSVSPAVCCCMYVISWRTRTTSSPSNKS